MNIKARNFESITNIKEVLSNWFANEYDLLKVIFFGNFYASWSTKLLLSFSEAAGIRLPVDVSYASCFFFAFKGLFFSRKFDNPAMESIIFEKCQDWMVAHEQSNPQIFSSFNARFQSQLLFSKNSPRFSQ